MPDAPAEFWTVELFCRELAALLEHLNIAGRYHVLGQSWGGMLGMEHALRHPPGLRALVVANSPASMPLWVAEGNRLRSLLPSDVQEALTSHEAAGTTDSPEYQAAMMSYYERHVCRIVPFPPELQRTFDQLDEDPTVYRTMNGPSEFHVIGSLKDWDITAQLGVSTRRASSYRGSTTRRPRPSFVRSSRPSRAPGGSCSRAAATRPTSSSPIASSALVADFLAVHD